MSRLAILGAGGHGKVLADIAELTGWDVVDFFDDRWPEIKGLECWTVAGNIEILFSDLQCYQGVIVAIGNNAVRLHKLEQLQQHGARLISLIHPRAVISRYAKIADGCCIMANAVVNPFVELGTGCIINTGATVDHDCVLGKAVHVCPGANLAGEITVGDCCWLGIGSSVKQQVRLGKNVMVGAGATVVNSISDNLTVVGTPAKSKGA